jgi:hypothetical protein
MDETNSALDALYLSAIIPQTARRLHKEMRERRCEYRACTARFRLFYLLDFVLSNVDSARHVSPGLPGNVRGHRVGDPSIVTILRVATCRLARPLRVVRQAG